MTNGVTRVVTQRRYVASGSSPRPHVNFVGAALESYGSPHRNLIKIVMCTICLTGQSPTADLSNPSLMIGGRAVKTLADSEVLEAIRKRLNIDARDNPKYWTWTGDGKDDS